MKNRSRDLDPTGYQYRLRRSNTPRYLLRLAKSRAKKVNVECSITVGDIIIPKFCPVLHIPIFMGEGRQCDNSPSIDRLDSSGGYTPSNIVVVSWKANRLKNNASVEELKALARFYGKKTRKQASAKNQEKADSRSRRKVD